MNQHLTCRMNPRVTIVIAVFNGQATIEKAIQSCLDQRFSNIQLVIMDGGSTDGTQDVLEMFGSRIDYWESNPDRGIYHAWNKALRHADGEWICFLGADDYWSCPEAIEDLVTEGQRRSVELVSAKVAIIGRDHLPRREYGTPWNWADIKRHHCIAHPGMLHHRNCFVRNGNYNENYMIAGDYEFSLRLGGETTSAFIDKVMVYMGDGGVSHSLIQKTLSEVRDAQRNHPEIGAWRAHYNYIQSRLVIAVKTLLGLI